MDRKKTALEYGREGCNAIMHRFPAAKDLPPVGKLHYHQGVFLSGMYKIYELSREERFLKYIQEYIDSNIDSEGICRTFDPGELDDMQASVLLFPLYHKTAKPQYKKALDRILPVIFNFPKNKEGGFWHKMKNPNQMWLDGLYMAGPACAQYGREFDHPEYFGSCIFQALLIEKKTKDEKTGLWYHAWDSLKICKWADPVTGRSPEFWGRAIGWVPVALLEELDYIPAGYPGRGELVRIVREILTTLREYQDGNSGLWYQVVDKVNEKDNWLETSCTCLYVAAMSKAFRTGILEESIIPVIRKGYEGVIKRLRYDGYGLVVDTICVGTGVGDYAHYCARPVSENDLHGMGAFTLMCAEVEKAGKMERIC